MMHYLIRPYSLMLLGLTAWVHCPIGDVRANSPGGSPPSLPTTALPTTTGAEFRFVHDPLVTLQVVCFLGNECPLAQLYGPRLVKMANDFQDRGVAFVGVNSNLQDSMDEVRAYTEKYRFPFPMVKDYDQAIARSLGATRTPEVVVIDAMGAIRYRGRIDDQYLPGLARSAATQHDLREAITALLASRPVTAPRTIAVGCLIGHSRPLAEQGEITFCDQVVRILDAHCVECHRPGEIGPFALTDYDEVIGWADMMLEVIEQGRMPPWHANPEFGHFKNARKMTVAAKDTFRHWVSSGMPYGDAAKLPKPDANTSAQAKNPQPESSYAEDWENSYDTLIAMSDRPYQIPAEGTVEYQYFVVDPKFSEDRWVRAASVIPGNRSVVHHAIVFIRPPDGTKIRGISWLSAYVPGQLPTVFPPGFARRISAHSKFVFQMHYTPNGTEAEDLTKAALAFVDQEEVTHEVFTRVALDQEFEIPPGATNHPVSMHLQHLPPHSLLLGVAPHMHLRGKSFRLTGQRITKKGLLRKSLTEKGDGKPTILLDVPQYDFNWQHFYTFSEPLKLDEWDTFDCSVTFDNSAQNPANPDPSQHVLWGDQTWEEMAIAFFEIGQPLAAAEKVESTIPIKSDPQAQQAREARVRKFVERFFQRFDTNDDGQVVRDETSLAFRRYGFRQFDQNEDHILDRNEIATAASARF